ncbi:MAG: hypothetical protein VSS75_015240 [Candidatus Parabeggiatoa sp.]|nr:hypothetical protein [Candidatus Parabeggiatoa sp.]
MYLTGDDIFHNWPYRWFGVWTEPGSADKKWPLRTQLTDSKWKFKGKKHLIQYLRSARIVLCSGSFHIHCNLCHQDIGDPGCWQSDNVWLWPCSLAHYVDKHHIRLPDKMLYHIVNNQFIPPTDIIVGYDDLPWPDLDLYD